jgi:hypothetical protein
MPTPLGDRRGEQAIDVRGSKQKQIHNKFSAARSGSEAASCSSYINPGAANKVTPTRVILFLSPHYV